MNYLCVLLLFKKQLRFMGLTSIQDWRHFIHSSVHSFHTQVFSAASVPGCVLGKGTVSQKVVPFLPIKSSDLKGEVGEEAENYVIRWR